MRKSGDRKKVLRRLAVLLLTFFATVLLVKTWGVIRRPLNLETSSLVVNDVTQLNPISVGRVIAPTTTAEIVAAVKEWPGPISIGGARHSMGGQIASQG